MEQPPGIEVIEQLDAHIEAALNRFNQSLASQANPDIYDKVLNLASKLKTNRAGIIRSVENLKTINALRKEIDIIIRESQYSLVVNRFFLDLQESTVIINSYFAALSVGFGPSALMREITRQYIAVTADNLIGAGVQGYFRNGIVEILKTNVTAGGSIAQLQKQLKGYIIENEGFGSFTTLDRYAGQVTHDALNQYSANYIEAISEDLGLSHYFYKGTLIVKAPNSDGSRKFCIERAGKAYTKAEVEAWGNQAAQAEAAGRRAWEGVYKGTNAKTIFTFRGGYRCRHRLVPITAAVYAKMKNL